MSVIDQVVRANETYARSFSLGHLTAPAARKLAVVACMDARLTVEQMLGLKTGDAQIIRNAGGIITEDALRSLVIAHHLLGTEAIMIIEHTDCGMLTFRDEELLERLKKQTGVAADAPGRFFAFRNLEENIRRQVQKVKSHPWIPWQVPIRGFLYDVRTGRLSEVT
jgi:carbonic anhydrase